MILLGAFLEDKNALRNATLNAFFAEYIQPAIAGNNRIRDLASEMKKIVLARPLLQDENPLVNVDLSLLDQASSKASNIYVNQVKNIGNLSRAELDAFLMKGVMAGNFG